MRGHAIEKPAIVRDDDCASGEILQRFLQRPHRVDVEIVRRLVEQQNVGSFFQHTGQVDAIAFAARQRPHLFLLILAGEIEARHVGPGRHLPRAEVDDVGAAGNLFEDRLTAVERPVLIDICDLHCLADTDLASVRLFLADDHSDERGLSRAVGTDHADDASGRELEGHLVDQQFVPVGFAYVVRFDDHVAQARPRRDVDLQLVDFLLRFLMQQRLVCVDARFAFGVTALG